MNDNAIEARALVKVFDGAVRALDGLDLTVPAGSLTGLLGRNGAGKTTFLRTLPGLLRPEQGEVRVFGRDPHTASSADRARVAYVAQADVLPRRYSTAELCRLAACFYPRFDAAWARQLAERFEVEWERRVDRLSGGARRKAAVLVALAARAELLLLDEPAAGLDPVARRDLIDVLVDVLAEGVETTGATIVLSTHLVGDLERLADRVAILDRGRLVRAGATDELRARLSRVQLVFDAQAPDDVLVPGALRQEREGAVLRAVVDLPDPRALDSLRARTDVRLDVFPLDLEDTFLELVAAHRDTGELLIESAR